jgi:hypothetical protein
MFEVEAHLTWKQRIAAYWAISWPAFAFSFLLIAFLPRDMSLSQLKAHPTASAVISQVIFFGAQALLVHRLPRKKFQTFRLEKVKDDGREARAFRSSKASRCGSG